jgi:hypothetical protein
MAVYGKVGPQVSAVDPANAEPIRNARSMRRRSQPLLGKRRETPFNGVMPAPAASDSLDWDEASHAVADAYFPHELHPLTRSTAANVVVDSVGIGPVRIAHIGWGAAVTVDTAHPGGYAVNIPVSGRLESVIGRNELVATRDCATIYPPDTPTCIRRWSESCSIVGVRFERDYLHREISRLLAESARRLPDHLDLTIRWFAISSPVRSPPRSFSPRYRSLTPRPPRRGRASSNACSTRCMTTPPDRGRRVTWPRLPG